LRKEVGPHRYDDKHRNNQKQKALDDDAVRETGEFLAAHGALRLNQISG
jgi:hypothetical protein